MEFTPVTNQLPLPNISPEQLAAGTVGVEEAAQAFESLFASLLLKEMRNTLSEGFFGSEGSDVLGGMFDMHMGQAMTEGSGLGIRQMVMAHAESQ